MVDADLAEAMAERKAGLARADDDDVSPFHDLVP
jgi:hypothetical protein